MTDTTTNTEMTVGEILRNARTTGRRKREIQTIAKLLCIREEFLEALESGDYHKIPEVIYVLGFARNYAMELGLDPDEIVLKVKREMGLAPDENPGDDGDDDSDAQTASVSGGSGMTWMARAWRYVARHWMWFFGALVVIVAAAAVALVLFRPVDAPVVVETVAAPVATENAEPVVPAGPTYNVAIREQFGTENAANANVILQAIQESWVKVEDARGNTVFSRVLVPGDIYYVPAGTRHSAIFGNAGGIDVWVNGRLAPKQGAEHVRRGGIILTPEKLMAGN